jgi:hypothetical protein
MMPTRPTIVAACVLCAIVTTPTTAHGQQSQQRRRPFLGLFGGDAATDRGQHLTLTGSVNGAYDDNILGDQGGQQVNRGAQQGGVYSGIQAGFDYTTRTDTLTLSIDGGTAARYYPDPHDLLGVDHRAGVSLALRLGKTTVQAAETLNYSPNYSLVFVSPMTRLAPDALTVPSVDLTGPDFQIATRLLIRSQSHVGVMRQLGTSSSLSFSYGHGYTGFPDSDGSAATRSHSAAVRFERQVTRHAGLRLGYGYREARTASADSTTSQDIDVGLNYSRALSISRRTTLSFGSGSSVVGNGNRTLFRLSGAADLEHDMGRTWTARLSYRRGLRFLEGFSEPTYGDSVNLSTAGYLGRRVDVSASAAYSSGQVGITSETNGFSAYVGTLKVQVAISRFLAAYTQYVYYHYRFRDTVSLPLGINSALERQGVRIGLTSSVPLF